MTTPDQPTDTAQLRAAVEAAQQTNDTALQALAQQGIQIGADLTVLTRLGILEQHLLGDLNQPARLAYEQAVQERFTAMIADIRSQITRAKLLAGVNGQQPPGIQR